MFSKTVVCANYQAIALLKDLTSHGKYEKMSLDFVPQVHIILESVYWIVLCEIFNDIREKYLVYHFIMRPTNYIKIRKSQSNNRGLIH